MPSTPRAKVSKQICAKMELTKEDILIDLAESWRNATGDRKIKLGLALLPYFMPKLKAVEHDFGGDGTVTINIGGASAVPKEVTPADAPVTIEGQAVPLPNEVAKH